MVEHHGCAQLPTVLGAACAPSRARFLHQPGFIEKFVALQHFLLVPGNAVGAEAEPHPVAAQFGGLRVWRALSRMLRSAGRMTCVDHRGLGVAPILPGKIAIPVAPARIAAP